MTIRPWTVEPVLAATVQYPPGHPRTGRGPVYVFAVIGDDGWVMVDAGVGPANGTIDALYAPERRDLVDELSRLGLTEPPRAIVLSHLHFDHCGGATLFPGVPLYVQASEYAAAREPKYTVREFVDFEGARYELVNGEVEVVPGVRAFPTPGHTPGHQSVAVDLNGGVGVVVAQATETAREWEVYLDGERAGLSAATISVCEAVARKNPVACWFSHDDRVWTAGGGMS